MGVLNAHVYNSKPYNQIQPPSVFTVVDLSAISPAKLALFNVLPYNAAPFNSGTPIGGMLGIASVTATFSKVLVISNVSPSILGVFNTIPYNSQVMNGAQNIDNSSGGKATMTAVIDSATSSLSANMRGSSFIGGPSSAVVASHDGGYNSMPYMDGPYNDAEYIDVLEATDQLVELITGSILEVEMSGSGDISPEPWLQQYNPNNTTAPQNSTMLTTNSKSVYLHTV